jgi:hypothetical protein
MVGEAGEPEPFANYCTSQYVQMEGANAFNRLGRPDRAVSLLRNALQSWPGHDQRDRGTALARLATAHMQAGEVEAACHAGRHRGQQLCTIFQDGRRACAVENPTCSVASISRSCRTNGTATATFITTPDRRTLRGNGALFAYRTRG